MVVRSIHLQNRLLEVTVLPDVGAKIFDLIHRPTGFNFLWHNPRIQPQAYPIDANFDNYWCGGWDDGFPTCEPCVFRGEQYPGLGELRSLCWTVEESSPEFAAFSAFGPINPVAARKTVRLNGGSVEMTYEITNLGPAGVDFLWGTHPAYFVSEHTVLHVPARTGIVGISLDSSLGAPGQHYAWPMLETLHGVVNVSHAMAAKANLACGHYATELSGGWYAVEHTDRTQSMLFEFDRRVCQQLWMWLSYGGWRGYHVAVIEPWTSFPVTLSEAESAGTHRHLDPGESFRTSVRATPGNTGQTVEDLLITSTAARRPSLTR